jgi:hypothetical protein
MMTMRPHSYLARIVVLLAVITMFTDVKAANLDCTTLSPTSPNITIGTAGAYDVTCAVSGWFLFVVGCTGIGGGSSAAGAVTLRLLSSPVQVIVSDNALGSLSGCAVNITYVADTVVPAAGASLARDAHVYVATASPLASLEVTVLGTLHIEGSFVAISGNNSGSIGLVALHLVPGSSVACRVASATVCSAAFGTSLLKLSPGCPMIDKVVLVLNGTNTSLAMHFYTPMTSLALIMLDNSSGTLMTPTPRRHEVAVANVPGALWSHESLITLLSSKLGLLNPNPYPYFSGTISVHNMSFGPKTASRGLVLFRFVDPVALVIVFHDLQSETELVTIVSEFLAPSGVGARLAARVEFWNCTVSPFPTLTFYSVMTSPSSGAGVTPGSGMTGLEVYARSSSFAPGNEFLPAFNVDNRNRPMLLTLYFTDCTFLLINTAVQVLTVTNTNMTNATISIVRSAFVQQWTPLQVFKFNFSTGTTYYLPSPSVSPIVFDANSPLDACAITFASCNVTSYQIANASTPSASSVPAAAAGTLSPGVAAIFLTVSGLLQNSTVTLRDTNITVMWNRSATVPLAAVALNISAGRGSLVSFRRSTFLNISTAMVLSLTTGWTTDDATNMISVCETTSCGAICRPVSVHSPPASFALIGGSEPSSATLQLHGCTLSPSNMLSRSVLLTLSQSKHRFHDSHTVLTETRSLVRNDCPIAVQPASTVAVSVVAYSAIATSTSVSAALARGAVPALQRANAALRFAAKCNSDSTGEAADDDAMLSSFADNPIQLSIAISSINDQYDHAAGAVVGNTALLIVVGGVSHLVGRIRISARLDDRSVDDALLLGRLCSLRTLLAVLPSSLLPGAVALPYTTLMQPTVSGCVVLLVGGAGRGSAALGAVFLALWVSVPMYFCWEIVWRYRGLLRAEDCDEFDGGGSASFPLRTRATSSVRGTPSSTLFVWLMRPTEVWVRPRRSDDNGALLVALYGQLEAIFEPYVARREWFFLVEWGMGIASGAILGAAEVMGSSDDIALQCRAADMAAWSGIAISGAQVLAYLILRPLQVRLELMTAAIVGALAVGSQILVLADASDGTVSSVILTATIVELLAVVLVMAREVFVEHKATLASTSPLTPAPTHRAPPQRHRGPQVELRLIVELVCTEQRRKQRRIKKEREATKAMKYFESCVLASHQ